MGVNVKVTSYRREREAEIMVGLQKSMEQVGQLVERQAKKNTTRPMPSGIVDHTWRDTGILAGSVVHKVTSDNNSITTEIGTNLKYGKYLEFGWWQTVGGLSSPFSTGKRFEGPYPWLFPAVEVNRNNIIKLLKGREFKVE
jgi:hypothetical protein